MDEFFASTPYLAGLLVRSRLKARRDTALVTAWHTEAFARHETLPDLNDLLADKVDEGSELQTDYFARDWAARWGLEFMPVAGEA